MSQLEWQVCQSMGVSKRAVAGRKCGSCDEVKEKIEEREI